MNAPILNDVNQSIVYPDSDGKPISDNTLQYKWIVTIQGNVDDMFQPDPQVFVAGDLLWYPVEGRPKIRIAADVMVVFGRPKGYRGSYKQWLEGNISPQVTFEILSPGNRPEEMDLKLDFYERYNVEEYYVYDPATNELAGYLFSNGELHPIKQMHGWVSPRLGIRFDLSGPELVIWRPDGERFLTFIELAEDRKKAYQAANQARLVAKQEQERANQAQMQVDQERRQREEFQNRAERLAARLRELGEDPDR